MGTMGTAAFHPLKTVPAYLKCLTDELALSRVWSRANVLWSYDGFQKPCSLFFSRKVCFLGEPCLASPTPRLGSFFRRFCVDTAYAVSLLFVQSKRQETMST